MTIAYLRVIRSLLDINVEDILMLAFPLIFPLSVYPFDFHDLSRFLENKFL